MCSAVVPGQTRRHSSKTTTLQWGNFFFTGEKNFHDSVGSYFIKITDNGIREGAGLGVRLDNGIRRT
jgi:hypothetical protein